MSDLVNKIIFIAAKDEPISVISRDYLKKVLSFQFFWKVDSTPIYVTFKLARRYGKDCESEVHVNLNFRMSSMISEMEVVLGNI